MAAHTAPARAQVNLTSFVNNPANGASALQINAGHAIQATCSNLAAAGGLQLPAGTATRDLFLRCNELVATSQDLQNGRAATGRGLGFTAPQLLSTIQQFSGEEVAAPATLSGSVSSGQFANIGGRLNALRFGSAAVAGHGRIAQFERRTSDPASPDALAAVPMLGFASAQTRPSADYDFFAGLAPAEGAAAGGAGVGMTASPWGWFTEGSYGSGNSDATASADAFNFDTRSVTAGVDYNFGAGVLGASVGYDKYTSDFDVTSAVLGGSAEVKGTSGSVFGAWFGDTVSVNGIVSYGSLDNEIRRRVLYTGPATCPQGCSADRTLVGKPGGNYVAVGVTAGLDYVLGGWDFAPSLSLAYRDVKIDSFAETSDTPADGLLLAYDSRKIESLRSIVGVTISRGFSESFGVLTPNLKLEYHHEFKSDPTVLGARFALSGIPTGAPTTAESCSALFCLPIDAADANFGLVGVGVAATFAHRLQGYLQYEALVGVAGLKSNTFSIGLRGQF
jgi:uncharacterized protein YhjY with autotransporter beta-barrel domain